MFTVYMDESGQDGGKACVVAGFIGNEEQWTSFVPDWEKALKPKKYLHMNRLRWKEPKTARLLSRLGPVPVRQGLKPVIAGLWHKDFDDLAKEYAFSAALQGFMTPWMLAAHMAMLHVFNWLSKDESVKFVFEQQDKYGPFMKTFCDSVFEAHKFDRRFVGIEFVPKGTTCRTDAADYLAFAARAILEGDNISQIQLTQSIFADSKFIGMILSRGQIAELMGCTRVTEDVAKEFVRLGITSVLHVCNSGPGEYLFYHKSGIATLKFELK